MSEITYSDGSGQEITFRDKTYVVGGQEVKFRVKDLTMKEIQYGFKHLKESLHQKWFFVMHYLCVEIDNLMNYPVYFIENIWEEVHENIEQQIEKSNRELDREIGKMEKSRIQSRLEILDIRGEK